MPHRSRKLAENLYFYIWQGRGNNCNTCLFTNVIRGGRPHVIIDPGSIVNELRETCFDSLLMAMQGDGFKVEDIGLIINTHTHPDHCEAMEAIVQKSEQKSEKGKATQALIALSREEEEYHRTVGEKLYGMLGLKVPQFKPFIYLVEGDLILGKERQLNLQILHTPGHSPGALSIYWADNKVLIPGDVVFYGGVGRTDFPGGSITLLKQSIEKLSKLEVEYLLPGHSTEYGSIIEGKDKVERNFQAVRFLI
ncbi:MAG TPA: MBL fold metallo-hydrolase [Dehalococcoidia bacterium]|nr:MBL fold metallo-hydrolase [Dehalococcoidia bacterium]